MAEIRYLENRQIAISEQKVIQFWWNLVHKCRFRNRWQLYDQIWAV